MENKKIVKEMVKLQILFVRWLERNTDLHCKTYGDIDRILKGGKKTITYKEASKNLKDNILKLCKNEYLLESVLILDANINNSEIKELRFGLEPQRKFTPLEHELDREVIVRTLFMNCEMVTINEAIEILNLNVKESGVKQACQQERLLNTQKVGKSWLVHIPECRAYWNISNEDESHLYSSWDY